MTIVWFLLVFLPSPAISQTQATNPTTLLYQLLKNYETKAAKEAFIKSGRKVFNFGVYVFLRTFDETEGKATVEVIQRRAWQDTTFNSAVKFPSNLSIISVPYNWVWMPDNLFPSKKYTNCDQYIRSPNWAMVACSSVVEVECLKTEKYRYPKDRFACRIRSKLSNSVRKQDIQCVNNTRLFYRRGKAFSPRIIYPPLPCRNTMYDKFYEVIHQRYPKDWKLIGSLERIVNQRLIIEFTLERSHPHYFKSDILLGAIAGIVSVSLSLFGLAPTQRLEISSIGLLIVFAHFQFTTEIPVVESGENKNLVSLSTALIGIQCVAVVWSIFVCNFQLICARLGALPPFLRLLFDRFIPSATEGEGEEEENEKQWKAAILIMDHIVFAILACALLVIFPITLL